MAALVQIQPERKRHPLGARTEIGRSPECDLVIPDASISRRHASLQQKGGTWTLIDLQSKFGSYVNELQISTPVTLKHGDRLRLGNVVLEFENIGGVEQLGEISEKSSAEVELGRIREQMGAVRGSAERMQQLEAAVGELEARLGELTRHNRKHEVLLAITSVINRFSSERRILVEAVIDEIMRALRAERCAILLPQEGMLVPRAMRNLPQGLPRERWAFVAGVYGGTVTNYIAEPSADGRTSYCLPLRSKKQQVIGLIYLEPPPGRRLERDELDLFEAISGQVELALDNVLLLESVLQEEQKRQSLSRYMNDKLVEAIVSGKMNLNLGGEYRPVSIMFVDIRGFTSISERLQPADILAMLNEYFTGITEAVFRVEGTVDKYIGDAMMAVFGAPAAYPDHAARAVRAAAEIRQVVQGLKQQWHDRPWGEAVLQSDFNVGIGVNSATVVAGNIGSARRMEYTVIGDGVNLASRLCSNAARGQILIGPETYEAVKDLVRTNPLAPLKVKGKAEPVQAYELLD